MKISVLQTSIVWENKQLNLQLLQRKLKSLGGVADLVVLPEMFSTGFSMNSSQLAEEMDGYTVCLLKKYAAQYRLALTGSFIALDDGHYYNRAFFITPEGNEYYYDKKHLFRMGDETQHFSAGNTRLIIPYKGWNICLMICYDLRFPVWTRNRNNEYDLLIFVANWPASRRKVWDALLLARALENMCYVCGVNCVGTDGNNLQYNGGSVIYSAKGEVLASVPDGEENIATADLSWDALREFRRKFPAWRDGDDFKFC